MFICKTKDEMKFLTFFIYFIPVHNFNKKVHILFDVPLFTRITTGEHNYTNGPWLHQNEKVHDSAIISVHMTTGYIPPHKLGTFTL